MNKDEEFYNEARLLTKNLVKEQVFSNDYVIKSLNYSLTKLVMANPNIRFMLARSIGLSINYDYSKENLNYLAKINLLKRYILYEKYNHDNLKHILIGIMRNDYYRDVLGVTLCNFILGPFCQWFMTDRAVHALKWDETVDNVLGGGLSGLYETLVDPSMSKNVYGYITNLFK